MKNVFNIFSFEKIKESLKQIYNRFPFSMVIIFIVAVIFFILLHYENTFSGIGERLIIANFSLIMTFFLSVTIYLTNENYKKTKLQRNLFQIIAFGFGIIFYNIFSLNPNNIDNFIFFFLSFTGIIAYFFFSPYFKNLFIFKKDFQSKLSQSVFYTYFYNISTTILISFIFGGVLFGLGAIGIASTDALFDLGIKEKYTYGNWAILALSIISPLFLLSQIPDKKSFLSDKFNSNIFFSFLIKFVAVPFIFIYFFILYAYTIKVLLNFNNWPKGEISWLVISFSIFGYLTYIFSYIFEKDSKAIKLFRKIFPFAVIPQVLMLFYAIYLRISEYDLTVNRYFVVIFGVWLLFISLYFIFSKKKFLITIPVSLAFFIILISILPKFNVYNYPLERQLNRLKTNLKKANILQDDKIVPLNNYNDITEKLSKNIYSGIDYICNFDNCEKIKKLFPKIYSQIEEEDRERVEKIKQKKYYGPREWEIVNKITDKIKVKSYFSKFKENKKYFEFRKTYKKDLFPLDITGYSEIYRIYNSKNNSYSKNNNYAIYNKDLEEIIIIKDLEEYDRFSTKKITNLLLKRFGKDNFNNLDKNDLIFNLENSKYKLIFENIAIKNPDYTESDNNSGFYYNSYTNGYLLIKEQF